VTSLEGRVKILEGEKTMRRWVLGWLVVMVCSPVFSQWQKTVKDFCQAVGLPPFSPVQSVPLKNLSNFSTIAIGWTLKNLNGEIAFAITDREGKILYEFGLGSPLWHESRFKQSKERIINRFGSFLSDGDWHFLYRGLGGYGLAVKKGMTVRVDARTFEPWGEGKEDASFSQPHPSFHLSSNRLLVSFGFPVLPSLRSTHAASCAMWAIGVGVVGDKEPYQKVIGDFSGLITRCLCDLPDKPFVHEIERGLPLFLKLRGRKGTVKTFTLSQTSLAALKQQFEKNKIAIVTFLYRKDQKEQKKALWRVDGTTVLSIGFWESPHGFFLISIPPSTIDDKPKKISGWSEGITIFRLDGPAANIVFAFPSLEGEKNGSARKGTPPR
jgi:hypothetical protein